MAFAREWHSPANGIRPALLRANTIRPYNQIVPHQPEICCNIHSLVTKSTPREVPNLVAPAIIKSIPC
jgi:hypothetical protein